MTDMKDFAAERNAALASLDEAKIRAYAAKYGVPLPGDPEIFWRSVHKAITAAPGIAIEVRRASKAWLEERGSKSHDDGDL